MYNLSERWVKNNRDPENIVYECDCYIVEYPLTIFGFERYKTSTSQHDKLLHDDTQYLLAMALVDKAFYGIESAAKKYI